MTKDHNDEVEPVAPTALQTVLFALRFYEGHRMAIDFPYNPELLAELTDNGRIATPFNVDIDALCERLQNARGNALRDALDNLVGPGAQHETTCDIAEHDGESGCIYCQARSALANESEGIDLSDIPEVGPEFFANARIVLPGADSIVQGARILSIHGENDEGDDGPRETGPDALGTVTTVRPCSGEVLFDVTFAPSEVWVILYAHEIADATKYRVVTDRHEIAARDAGWTHGGDGDGFIWKRTYWDSWKAAASWAGQGEHENQYTYATWAECCEAEDIEVTE